MIGLCAALERARFGVWEEDASVLSHNYMEAVQRAGGVAVMFPPDPDPYPDPLLDVVDALILAGGRDIDPAAYGAQRDRATDDPHTVRDAFEIALARRAMERDIPLLGICRGMQLMNVARGGTLVQDLPAHLGHRRTLGTFQGNDHPVRLADGSLAARVAGETHHATLSHHHQGIERIGTGLRVSGWSEDDELPEAIEDPQLRFALGVQWHPEADPSSPVIAALVDEARRR